MSTTTGQWSDKRSAEDRDGGTEVIIVFEHIRSGIRPEDNEAGCRSSLEKLARDIE
jgi:hypothetical protein